ncbi:hypothetical protein [Brotaphodocola sp.]|uniref:hypothetical protein n=1 Tax=Brotaphodocola sp. TaxID=3073577 RepID=UPI003D7EBB7C
MDFEVLSEKYRIVSVSIPGEDAGISVYYSGRQDLILIKAGIKDAETTADLIIGYLDLSNKERSEARELAEVGDEIDKWVTDIFRLLDNVTRIRKHLSKARQSK